MKVILGHCPNNDFRVIADDGTDITEHLQVKSVTITASANERTKIVLDCYGEVEAEGDTTLEIDADNVEVTT